MPDVATSRRVFAAAPAYLASGGLSAAQHDGNVVLTDDCRRWDLLRGSENSSPGHGHPEAGASEQDSLLGQQGWEAHVLIRGGGGLYYLTQNPPIF